MIMKIHKAAKAEVDDMWSFVEKKAQQRWLWHAIKYRTGVVLASVLATQQADVFWQ